jgi:hypothetical protein
MHLDTTTTGTDLHLPDACPPENFPDIAEALETHADALGPQYTCLLTLVCSGHRRGLSLHQRSYRDAGEYEYDGLLAALRAFNRPLLASRTVHDHGDGESVCEFDFMVFHDQPILSAYRERKHCWTGHRANAWLFGIPEPDYEAYMANVGGEPAAMADTIAQGAFEAGHITLSTLAYAEFAVYAPAPTLDGLRRRCRLGKARAAYLRAVARTLDAPALAAAVSELHAYGLSSAESRVR